MVSDVLRDSPSVCLADHQCVYPRPLSAIMKGMPVVADDDMPAAADEQRRRRRKKRYVAPPEVVLVADGFEFRNCAYFGFVFLEPRSCLSVPHIEPFRVRLPPPCTAGSFRLQTARRSLLAELGVDHSINRD